MGARLQVLLSYTPRFKEQMLKRLLGANPPSVPELARETGVSMPALYRWLREARRVEAVSPRKPKSEAPPPKQRTALEKLRLVVEADGLTGEQLSALLRREGIYESELQESREAAATAIAPTTEGAPGPLSAAHRKEMAVVEKRVRELERELRRKEKALAEVAALLVLEKKLQALGWTDRSQGDEDDVSDEKKDK